MNHKKGLLKESLIYALKCDLTKIIHFKNISSKIYNESIFIKS